MTNPSDHEDLEDYGDPRIVSANAAVPLFLKWTYIILPIWGILTFAYYWNGSRGWLDRGYWEQLQRAANTTYPFQNLDEMKIDQEILKPKKES